MFKLSTLAASDEGCPCGNGAGTGAALGAIAIGNGAGTAGSAQEYRRHFASLALLNNRMLTPHHFAALATMKNRVRR